MQRSGGLLCMLHRAEIDGCDVPGINAFGCPSRLNGGSIEMGFRPIKFSRKAKAPSMSARRHVILEYRSASRQNHISPWCLLKHKRTKVLYLALSCSDGNSSLIGCKQSKQTIHHVKKRRASFSRKKITIRTFETINFNCAHRKKKPEA